MLIWRVAGGQRNPVLQLDIVVGEDIDVQQPIDIRHCLLEISADEATYEIRSVTGVAQAIVVIAGDAGSTESAERGS